MKGARGAYLTALTVFVGAVVALSAYTLVRQRHDALARGAETAATQARAIESYITQSIFTTEVIAANLARQSGSGVAALQTLLGDAPFVRSLSLIDARGRIVSSTARANVGLEFPLDDCYPATSDPAIPRICVPWRGRDFSSGTRGGGAGTDLGFIPMLIEKPGPKRAQRVLIALNPDFFLTHVVQNIDPAEGRIDVIRYDDVLLMSSDARRRPGEPGGAVGDHFDLRNGDFGRVPADDVHGAGEISYIRASGLYPFAVVAHVDAASVLADWRSSAFALSATVGTATAIIAVLGAIYVRRRQQLAEQRDALDRLERINAACVFANAQEGILITGPESDVLDVNDAFTRLTGYTRSEVLGRNPRFLASGAHDAAFFAEMWRDLGHTGHWRGEIANRRKSGEVFHALQTISAVRDDGGAVRQYVSLFSDITDSKRHAEQLERAAYYDALTGLPNRILLTDRINLAIEHADRNKLITAVVFIDLDGFKEVNDTHGHDAGDQLLFALATRMTGVLRKGDTLGRLGGDEFVAVLQDVGSIEGCVEVLHRLLETARMPILVGGVAMQVSASLGVTFFPQTEPTDADHLVRQADQAMYQAKIAGRNRFHVFDAVQDQTARIYHENLERIRAAIRTGAFELHYQPVVNVRSGWVRGFEALVRWSHPERGLVAPLEFLPMIEGHALAVEMGEWVIDTALAQLQTWLESGLDVTLSVNVAGVHLQQPEFPERLAAALRRFPRVPPQRLQIEILESAALADLAHTSATVADCRALGVRFALDDFGTGYSSLAYLKNLPVDTIKIDRSFVHDMLGDPESMAVIRALFGLSRTFAYENVAEGVETAEQWAVLRELGCEYAQGFGVGRPMPAAAVAAWTEAWIHNCPFPIEQPSFIV